MKLLVSASSYDNAIELIDLGVDQICVGARSWSTRTDCLLSFREIETLVNNKKNTEILISLNRFFFEEDITKLTIFIKKLVNVKIDGIIFNDFAINQICFENNLNIKLIYDPEILVTNNEQFDFYLKNNVFEVCLSKDLNKNEIKQICENKKSMKVQIQVEGYVYIMSSKWKLISLFLKNKNIDKHKMYIRELTRKEKMIISEDKYTSSILTNYSLSLFEKINELKQLGVDTIKIESYLHNDEWVINKAKQYMQKNNYLKYDNEKTSLGFYDMNKENLMYLDKVQIYE